MSRSFGDNYGSFFHIKIQGCIDDLNEYARYDVSHWMTPLFEELYPICSEISALEDGDSGVSAPITEIMKRLPEIRKWVEKMEARIAPFEEVSERAIIEFCEGKKDGI